MRSGPRFPSAGLLAALLLALPATGRASVESFGVRQLPLAAAPEYGEIAANNPGSGSGILLVATRDGVEFRLEGNPGAVPDVYRTNGAVSGVAAKGTHGYLFLGERGIEYLSLLTPLNPRMGATLAPTPVTRGDILDDGSCVAAGDSSFHLFRLEAGPTLRLLQSISYTDGRVIRRVRTQGDSILVVASRLGVLPRLYLSVYRLPAGASAATLLEEWIYNGRGAVDAAWRPPVAFVADGNAGIQSINTATGAVVQTIPFGGGFFARTLDAGATDLFVAGEPGVVQRFTRSGALGESLQTNPTEALELEAVSLAAYGAGGRYAMVTTRDALTATEPDEPGRSQIEFPASSAFPPPGTSPIRNQGRSRRMATANGLTYVADYTGGLRIYRFGDSDTSLVGVLPAVGSARVIDLALDAGNNLVYLAAGAGGLDVVDVSNPQAPQSIGSLALAGGLVSAVARIDPSTVAVAVRGVSAGVTFVDVSIPSAPAPRGSVTAFFQDPRALAVRDTILFVADEQLGVVSVRFGNLDAPAVRGNPSGSAARDLDLQGTTLLVATRTRGLQVVDVTDPVVPLLTAEVLLPPMFGVTRQGTTAVACLGDEGVALLDIATPNAVRLRGTVPASGRARDAIWSGDTLLVAAGTSIERFVLATSLPAATGLSISIDAASGLPRAVVAWTAPVSPAQAGWNVYRSVGPATSGSNEPGGARVNDGLLLDDVTTVTDDGLVAGAEHRYRLEAVFEDGRLLTVAEGSIFVPSTARMGRPYPNPFRPEAGTLAIPYRSIATGGAITLRVLDLRGRLVREVRGGPPGGGFGEFGWDGRDRSGRRVPSGIYYLYVQGGGVDDARSVVLLR
jgi:hypothetical protein